MMYMHGYEIAKCDYAKNDEWCCASELVFYSIKKIGKYVLDFMCSDEWNPIWLWLLGCYEATPMGNMK